MKKLLVALLFPGACFAAPWDLMQPQLLGDGATIIQQLMPRPSGGAVNAMMVYTASDERPHLFPLSGCSVSSGSFACSGVNADWNAVSGAGQILNKPTLATVATSGAYADLSGKPSLATVATTGSASDLGSGTLAASRLPGSIDTTLLANGQVSNTEFQYLDGVSSGIQTQIDGKFASPSGTTAQYIRGDGSLATFPLFTQSSTARSLNSAFQISATRPALATYSVQCTITASIAGGQNCDVILEIASDSGFTTNVQTVSIAGTGQSYTLALALQGVQPQTGVLTGFIPPAYYTRLRTVQNTGTPTFSYRAGQEVLL